MSIRIEIDSVALTPKSGTSKQGKPFSFREQSGYAYTLDANGNPHKHPQPIKFVVDADQQPYPVGMYTLDLASLYVGRFGNLEVGHLKLKPLVQAAAQKAAA